MRSQPEDCHSRVRVPQRSLLRFFAIHQNRRFKSNPALPSELGRIIGKALEKDRDLRYQSASELRADLKRLKRDTGSHSSVVAALPTVQRGRRKLYGLVAAAVIIVGFAIAFFMLPRPLPPPRILATTHATDDRRPKLGPFMTDGSRLYSMRQTLHFLNPTKYRAKAGIPFHFRSN